MCPHQESNLDLELRRFSFYPLNYGDKTWWSNLIYKIGGETFAAILFYNNS